MIVKVLGSSGSEGPGHNPPAFLVDDFLLMDAGTVSLSLDREAQCKISHIFLTHAHLDHIKGIPFLVDNIAAVDKHHCLTILSGKDVLADLRKNIFNNRIWPDFSVIPTRENPVMQYAAISPRARIQAGDYMIYATRVSHSVPAYGFMIESPSGSAMVYSGDTGPTKRIWRRMQDHTVKVLIIEVSFPDAMMDLALASGHLTPSLLAKEIRKMPDIPEKVYATHLKPYYRNAIEDQLANLNGLGVKVLEDGMVISV